MNDNLKFLTKLSAVAALKWSVVFIPGILLTLTFALITGFQSAELFPRHGGGEGILYVIFIQLALTNPCAFLVLVGAPAFITLYFIVANKVAVQSIMSGIWENKAIHLVEPAVKRIVDTYLSGTVVQKTFSAAKERARLLDISRKDPHTSGATKRVITYAFKKIPLEETELHNTELSLGDIISTRVSAYISDAAQPGFGLFWILAVIHVALFIGAQIFNT